MFGTNGNATDVNTVHCAARCNDEGCPVPSRQFCTGNFGANIKFRSCKSVFWNLTSGSNFLCWLPLVAMASCTLNLSLLTAYELKQPGFEYQQVPR